MKKKRSLLLLISLATVMLLAVTIIYINGKEGLFESRGSAQEENTFFYHQSLRNQDRLFFSAEPRNEYDVALWVNVKKENGTVIQESIIFPEILSYGEKSFFFTSDKLDPSDQRYYIEVYPCSDEKCEILCMEGYLTELYTVEEPKGSIVISDNYCSNKTITLNESLDTNRDWLLYEIYKKDPSGNKIKPAIFHEIHDRWAFCEAPKEKTFWSKIIKNAYACFFPNFEPESDTEYIIELSYCKDEFKIADENCTGGAECLDCLNPELLSSQNYSTPKCESNEVDLQVDDISVPTRVTENDKFKISTTIRNNTTDTNSGSLKVIVYILDSQSSILDLQTFEIQGDGLIGGSIYRKELEFNGRNVGNYYVKTMLEITGSKVDSNQSNNSLKKSFSIISIEPTGCTTQCPNDSYQKDDCTCVSCLLDSHCKVNEKCDNGICKCNNNLCSKGKIMNSDCTACICAKSCPVDQWQDTDCNCHSNVCTLTCGSKQILKDNCTCQDVACKNDSHCSGMKSCSEQNTCVCELACPSGKRANDNCDSCVCANTCESGQTQKADCTCVTGEVLQAETQDVKLEIESAQESIYVYVNNKEIFSVKILGDYDIDPSKISWKMDDDIKGTGMELVYTYEEEGGLMLDLYYDNEKKDDIIRDVVRELEETEEVVPVEVEEEFNTEDSNTTNSDNSDEDEEKISRTSYLALVLIIIVTLSLIGSLLIYLNKKKKKFFI